MTPRTNPRTKPHRAARIARTLEPAMLLAREVRRAQRLPFGGRARGRSQLEVLFLLAHAPDDLTPSALAAALEVTPGAVTQLVDTLRGDGLVEQHAHPTDARSRVLRLTSAAAAEVDRYEASVIERVARRFDDLTDADLDALADLLERVAV